MPQEMVLSDAQLHPLNRVTFILSTIVKHDDDIS